MNRARTERYGQQAEEEYGSTADGYAARDEERWRAPSGSARALEEVCEQVRPTSVLELGVGTGRYLPFVRGTTFCGVDVSRSMLDQADARRSLLQDNGFADIDLELGELHEWLRSGTSRFDLVYSIGCLGYHVPVTVGLLHTIRRRLQPKGHLVLQTTREPWRERVKLAPSRLLERVQPGSSFSSATTAPGLRARLGLAGFETVWTRDDDRTWKDRPMLLTHARSRR